VPHLAVREGSLPDCRQPRCIAGALKANPDMGFSA
jgi:hypothetical protein